MVRLGLLYGQGQGSRSKDEINVKGLVQISGTQWSIIIRGSALQSAGKSKESLSVQGVCLCVE